MRSPFRALANEYARAYRGLPRRAWVLFGVNLVNASGSMVIFFLSLYLTRTLGYSESFHGIAIGLGGTAQASCVDCHGVHDIRPAADPESKVFPASLARPAASPPATRR